MATIKNKDLTVTISPLGAEIQRITVNGSDVLWNGDPKVWSGRAPVLFPICGGLKDDKYTFEGKEYTLTKHGFAKYSTFSVEKSDETYATFLLTDNEETLKSYPWHFEFRVTYELNGKTLKVSYHVKNKNDKPMYMSLGSHEAYACPEGIEQYDIIFSRKETLYACELDGNLISDKKTLIMKENDILPLKNKYFAIDALIFKDLKSRRVTLENRKNGRRITVDFNGCNYLLIWTKPGAKYIAIEPWAGFPPVKGNEYAIEEKIGINRVEPNCDFDISHSIFF